MRNALILTAYSLVLAALFAPLAAAAECDPQAPGLLWVYPEKNQADVPIDCVFTVLVTRDHPVTVSLDDAELPSGAATGLASHQYAPGALMPGTSYKLIIEIGDGPTTKKVQVPFTTAATAAAEPSVPTLGTATPATTEQDGVCAQVAAAQSCDIDAATRMTLAPAAGAIAWVVTMADGTELLWPGTCAPEAFATVGAVADETVCFEVRSLGGGGALSDPATVCPYAAAPTEGTADAGTSTARRGAAAGCTVSSGAAPGVVAPVLLMLFAFMLGIRRAHR